MKHVWNSHETASSNPGYIKSPSISNLICFLLVAIAYLLLLAILQMLIMSFTSNFWFLLRVWVCDSLLQINVWIPSWLMS